MSNFNDSKNMRVRYEVMRDRIDTMTVWLVGSQGLSLLLGFVRKADGLWIARPRADADGTNCSPVIKRFRTRSKAAMWILITLGFAKKPLGWRVYS